MKYNITIFYSNERLMRVTTQYVIDNHTTRIQTLHAYLVAFKYKQILCHADVVYIASNTLMPFTNLFNDKTLQAKFFCCIFTYSVYMV